ncbi:MAG: rhamnulose-1-phosphate aldolase [Bacteroidetes bacterium]|nr:rhamnulose-1-phosphate aldolase [Bacteroidota bacterium]
MKVAAIIISSLKNHLDQMKEVAGYMWEKGWAEATAGNMSIDVTEKLMATGSTSEIKEIFASRPFLNISFPGLANHFILVTFAGARMRDLAKDPLSCVGLIKINAAGDACQAGYFRELLTDVKPTSELMTHLAIHNFLANNSFTEKSILHGHIHELVALSHIKEYKTEKKINELLWSMHPEMSLFLPEGIGYISYMKPGTDKIAQETVKKIKKHPVILWEKHGCLSIGVSLNEAFDRIDIAAKAARQFFYSRNAGYIPQGLTSRQFSELKKESLKRDQ